MTNEPRPDPESADPEFERLVEQALRFRGWLLPRTVGDVERAERDPEIQRTELPESLRDASHLLDRAMGPARAPASASAPKSLPTAVQIPPALAELASEVGLSYQQSVTLLGWYGQQFANRSSTKNQPPGLEDWRRLYHDVKEFL